MSVLNVSGLSVYFGDNRIFENVSFEVGERDRIGLVGVNSAGKTTLFKVIKGELAPTQGIVARSRDVSLGYMEQHACEGSPLSVRDELMTVFKPLEELERRLDETAAAIDGGAGDIDSLIAEQARLREEFERRDGLTYRSRARSALLGLGFEEETFSMPVKLLSGGQRSKLSLAKLLLTGAELLLLDEPTNHLDIDSVEWLEGFVREYSGAALIISHDRYFLDRVTSKTAELSHGKLTLWQGGYSKYLEDKVKKDETDRRHYDNEMAEIRRIEAIIEQQRRWGRERNFITAASKQKMLDKKRSALTQLDPPEREVRIRFDVPPMGGNEVVVCRGLAKSFGDKRLFSGADFTITRGERVFLLGPNGCGKTTMLKILLNRLPASAGLITPGQNIRTGYFEQGTESLDSEKTVLDEVWDSFRSMDETQLRSALAALLFKGETVYRRVSALSGGEKARVALLKLMLGSHNFLLLDEPTNHLDIASREALERALADYGGTILAVSHDRYFINKLSTRILYLNENGVEECPGGYDDYLRRKQDAARPRGVGAQPKAPDGYKLRRERESARRRLEGKISRCEESVAETEAGIAALSAELAEPGNAADYERVLEISGKNAALERRLAELMDEWEELQTALAEYE